jgi:drug/metabolite transporter (DMT)-like permease
MLPAMSDRQALRADGLLLITAMIWGSAFVAQRVAMDHVGPLTFNGMRFALGAVFLLPWAWRSAGNRAAGKAARRPPGETLGPWIAGLVLFAGASFQQWGIVYTTAGKAGFITGLYVVLVPLFGIALGYRATLGVWTGTAMAAGGLYLLSVRAGWIIAPGDLLVFVSACCWALHVLVVARLAPSQPPLRLACWQFSVCAVLSLVTGALLEPITLEGLAGAAPAIAYGGLMSVGIGYTLQVVAQRRAPPSHAAVILSLEAVFAALSGWLLLDETLSGRGLIGCGLMLAGWLVVQRFAPPLEEPPALAD